MSFSLNRSDPAWAMLLRIEHSTRYRYHRPVEFTPHRLRLLPRITPGLRIVSSSVIISPDASIRWRRDEQENPVGIATIVGLSRELLIESSMVLEREGANPFNFLLEERSLFLPVSYTRSEARHLLSYLGTAGEEDFTLREWLSPLIPRGGEQSQTIPVLIGINRCISEEFRHVPRHEYGVRTPGKTIRTGEGTCRDFALLLIEIARSLGIAARYVSGYLCGSQATGDGESHTHGWCELYLPGAGWIGFDPANGILADSHHVPVAVSDSVGEIPPVEGTYLGSAADVAGHDVRISATEISPGEEA